MTYTKNILPWKDLLQTVNLNEQTYIVSIESRWTSE